MKTKATSQSDKKFLRALSASFEAHRTKFGSSKAQGEYTLRLKQSMSRYESGIIDNVFAVVMCGGTGKTHLAKKHGLVDIDECVSPEEHNALFEVRRTAMMQTGDWVEHNEFWCDRVRQTLEALDRSRPIVVLCHTEEVAYEIGAIPMGMIYLDEPAWESNIAERTGLSLAFSRYNRETVLQYTKVQRVRAMSNDDVERYLIKLMCLHNVPVAVPNKYEAAQTNCHYAAGVPQWILTGDQKQFDVDVLLAEHASGRIPKEAVDYFMRREGLIGSYGFGVGMDKWASVMASVVAYSRDLKLDVPSGDPSELWPYESNTAKNKQNITMRRLVSCTTIMESEEARALIASHIGANNAFVASLVLFWRGLGIDSAVAEYIFRLCLVSERRWVQVQKQIHELVRQSRFFMNTEISMAERQAIMYMDQLIGRRLFKVDEDSEVADRTKFDGSTQHLAYDAATGMWSRDQYRLDFNTALDLAFARVVSKPKPFRDESYQAFLKRRGEWLTTGSTVATEIPAEHRKYCVDVIDEVGQKIGELAGRHNKRSLFEEKNPFELMGRGLEFENVTKAVGKLNECGHKDRTLLPGALLHYLVFAYVLDGIERQEQIGSVRIGAEKDDHIRYMDSKLVEGAYHLLYDWANFNAQHSSEEMAAVVAKMAVVPTAPADWHYFCQAISASMWELWLKKSDGKVVRLKHGLFSGWRGTSWINGALNDVYCKTMMMSFARIYGHDPIIHIDHGGDDVDFRVKSPEDAYKILVVMDRMQFEAQKMKQMVSESSEFFRITYDKGRAHGSPTRALARFVSGNWESLGAMSVKERIVSVLDQTAKLRRRGVSQNTVDVMTILAITHWAKVHSDVEWLAIPEVALHGCLEQGGLGVPDKNGEVWTLDRNLDEGLEAKRNVVPGGTQVSEDMVDVLRKELAASGIVVGDATQAIEKLAAKAYDEIGEITYHHLLNAEAEVVSKNPVVVPKWDENIFRVWLEFVESDREYRKVSARLERYRVLDGLLSAYGKPIDQAELARMLGMEIPLALLEFKGSPYYRRLVGEEHARLINEFVEHALLIQVVSSDEAHEVFETLTYMSSVIYGHMV